MGVDTDTARDGFTSIEISNASEMESESNAIDSLEVGSSSGFITQHLRSAAEILTTLGLDLACSSEKLVNLEVLVMHVEARQYDFEAFALDEESVPEGSDEKALEFDLLSGILDSEVKELDSFLSYLQSEIPRSQEVISSLEQFGEAFKRMEEKLYDCEQCLKQSFDRVTELQEQSSSFQRILLTSVGDENWKDNKVGTNFENSDLFRQNTKIKMKTVEEQRKILQMLEKSLARELDLEKKLSEIRQTEEDLNIRLQQEVYCMVEEVEVTSERLFEAENTAAILSGTSKELLDQVQILQFKLNGSVQREEQLRSEVQDRNEQLKDKDCALEDSERTRSELVEKVTSLEQKLKDGESHLQMVKDSSDKNEVLSSKLHEAENIISQLKEKAYNAEQRCESVDKRVEEVERQLKESEIQRQHAVAFAEASQEKQSMLECTIKDMENLIDSLKSKVSKAESHAESAEEKCIILSEANADLSERINILTRRTEVLETSLHQAEEANKEAAKDIVARTKCMADLVVQLALERERIHKKILALVNAKKIVVKHMVETCEDPAITTNVNFKANTKKSMLSEDDSRNANAAEEGTQQTTESLTTSHEAGNMQGDAPVADTNMERTNSTSKLETVRNMDAKELNLKYVLMALLVVLISALAAFLFQNC